MSTAQRSNYIEEDAYMAYYYMCLWLLYLPVGQGQTSPKIALAYLLYINMLNVYNAILVTIT